MEFGGLIFFALIMSAIAIQQRKNKLPPFCY
jgi:hypothetical protein